MTLPIPSPIAFIFLIEKGGQDMAKAPKQPEEGEPATAKQTPNKQQLTASLLDRLQRTRPHHPQLIWDTKQDGLCALVSRGPASKKQATISLRVCYYLKSKPGKPHYIKIGRYPDGIYRYKDAPQIAELPRPELVAELGA
jgi:hypothetical protein